jgi:hypothetical protein
MKNLWSILAAIFSKEKSSLKMTPISIRTLLLTAAVSTLFIINACRPELSADDTTQTTDNRTALAQKQQQDVAEIEDNIKNSYARLASKYADICPKLIQKDVDKNTIERTAEVMVGDHCDYFLYPRSGQHIAVSLDNDQIEALLIVPTLHDFANGDYPVTSYDKHVIRLTYNGATYKPERLSYDVSVSVLD